MFEGFLARRSARLAHDKAYYDSFNKATHVRRFLKGTGIPLGVSREDASIWTPALIVDRSVLAVRTIEGMYGVALDVYNSNVGIQAGGEVSVAQERMVYGARYENPQMRLTQNES